MTSLLPPIPPSLVQDRAAGAWLREVARRITAAAAVTWASINFTGSSLADILTRTHSLLTSILGADDTSADTAKDKHVSNAQMKANTDHRAASTGVHGISGAVVGTTDTQSLSGKTISGLPCQIVNTETGAVATGTTTFTQNDTIPTNANGDQYMSLAITPKSATSTLIIDVVFVGSVSSTNAIAVALFQDATANALAAASTYQPTGTGLITIPLRHKMTSGTTSATTFKVRAGPSNGAGTVTFNGVSAGRIYGGVMASSMTITEVFP